MFNDLHVVPPRRLIEQVVEKNPQLIFGVGSLANQAIRYCNKHILAMCGSVPEFVRQFSVDTTGQSELSGVPPLPDAEFFCTRCRDLGSLLAAENARRQSVGLGRLALQGGANGEGAGGIAFFAALMLAFHFHAVRQRLLTLLAPFARTAIAGLAGRSNHALHDLGIRVRHDAVQVDVWWINSAPGGTSGSWQIWQAMLHAVAAELDIRVEIHEIDLLAAIGSGGDAAARHMLVNVMRTMSAQLANFESRSFEFSALDMHVRSDKVLASTRSLIEPPANDLPGTIRAVGVLVARLATGAEGVKFLQSAVDAVSGPLARSGEGHGQPLLYSAMGWSEIWAAPPNSGEFAKAHLLAEVLARQVAAASDVGHAVDEVCQRLGIRSVDLEQAAPTLHSPVVPVQLPVAQVPRTLKAIEVQLQRAGDAAWHQAKARLQASLATVADTLELSVSSGQSLGSIAAELIARGVLEALTRALALVQQRMDECAQHAQQIVPVSASLAIRVAALTAVQQNRARAAFFREAQPLLVAAQQFAEASAERWSKRSRDLRVRLQSCRDSATSARQVKTPSLLVHSYADLAAVLQRDVVPAELAELQRQLASTPSTKEVGDALKSWEKKAEASALRALAPLTAIGRAVRDLPDNVQVTHLRRWHAAAEPSLRVDPLTPAHESSVYTITDLPADLHSKLEVPPNRPCPANEAAPNAFMLIVRHGIAPTSLPAAREAWTQYYASLAAHATGLPIWVDPDFAPPALVLPSLDEKRLLLLPLVSRLEGGPVKLQDGRWVFVNGHGPVPLMAPTLGAVAMRLGESGGRVPGLPSRDEILDHARNRLEMGAPPERVALLARLLGLIAELGGKVSDPLDRRFLRDAQLAAQSMLHDAQQDQRRGELYETTSNDSKA